MPLAKVVDSVGSLLKLKKKQAPQLTREQAMSAKPVRNPSLKWRENDEGEVIVILPRRKDLVGKFLGWMFFVPEARPLALDEVGAFVWEQCDGAHTVGEIVELLRKEYKLERREVEVSLTEYLKTLGKRGMVGFLVPKEIAEELGEGGKELVGLEEDVGSTEEELEAAREREAQEPAEAESEDSEATEGGPEGDPQN